MLKKGIVLLFALIIDDTVWCTELKPCPFWESVNITDGKLQSNGSILHDEIMYSVENYAKFDYIVYDGEHESVENHTRGCICKQTNRTCIYYCCEPDVTMHPENSTCNYNDESDFDLPMHLHRSDNMEVLDKFTSPKKQFMMIDYVPVCKDPFMFFMYYLFEIKILENGLVMDDMSETFTPDQYCLSQYRNKNPHNGSLSLEYSVMLCQVVTTKAKYTVLPIGMLISVPFLIITFIVYSLFAELHNLHGKCFMSYLVALTLVYLTLGYNNLYVPHLGWFCTTIGYIIYATFMSAFLWLNVISFDLWRNFNAMSKKHETGHRQFCIYSLYAWGLSAIFTGLCYSLDQLDIPFKPNIGYENCFLEKKKLVEFVFFYMPVILIIASNTLFFTLTFLKIRRLQTEIAKFTSRTDSMRHHASLDSEKDKFTLFLRLFIIMGITWSMDAITWALENNNEEALYIANICNSIQGVIIFLVFVLRKKIQVLFRKKWGSYIGIRENSGTTRSSGLSTTQTIK